TGNQRRLWLISNMDPDIASYIIPFTFKLKGGIDQNIFQKSIERLFNRHHNVFSRFKEINGEPFCDIVPSEVKISFPDYSGSPEAEKVKKLHELIDADSKKVFDLTNGPLYRLYLISIGNEEYYFHFSIHHIVFDGWSWAVFANDFSKIYNSLRTANEPELGEIAFQEYDYALWEQSAECIESEKKAVEFWRENLKDSSPIITFPYDFPRSENPSGIGRYENLNIPAPTTKKLRDISSTSGTSLFTTLFGIFGIQMQKYSGQDDLNIGMPVAYRPHSKLEDIFGMFVNTVVVRFKFSKGQTLREIIKQTNEAAMNAITYQNLAFDKVVDLVNPERSTNVNPLFQVAFAWQSNLNASLFLDGVTAQEINRLERAVEFDITLNLWENENSIDGAIEYNTDILTRETILRLKDNFIHMVETFVDQADAAIKSIPAITPADLNLIESFNQTRTDYPRESTIAQLFEEQATLYPDKQAVVYKDKYLTYSQFNQQANKIARTLRRKGVGANSLVGIMADKSIEMIAGIFAILKAGGAYVPMDPDYPEQRMNFIAQDLGLKLLLTQQKFSNLPIEGIDKIYFEDQTTYDSDGSNVEGVNTPDDLAYIIYTSGTTGTPKGSLIPQRGVVRLVRNTNYVEYTPADKVSQASAIVFDASTEEIFGALLNGCPLYVIDKETLLDPNAFGDILLKNNITIVDLTSALFTQIAEARTDIFAKVKYLILGGDVVSAPHVAKVRRANPQITVVNTYGPTENSCNSTAFKIDRDFDYNIPIGKPISNSTAYIFDKHMNYQPIGVIGELYVGGDGLSKGYLNRDDLNRTAFIYNPHNPSERLYKTGDLARWLPDGNIEFHGRIDNQIKIRGYRVELEEIESVISDIDGVIETVIKPIKVEEGDYKLIAFLNVPENSHISPDEIEKVIKAKLPPYMVPSAYKFMNGFPKNVNGKIDRKALTFDMSELSTGERKETGELTNTEKKLIEIWAEILKTKDILTTDNFFDIGGNSLMTINLSSKIEKNFNIEFNLRNFFTAPRIKDLALQIDLKQNLTANANRRPESSSRIIEGEI
ncbi:MAG TPA: amino acid adenylation domain-containing protein, partial [Bacteroidales bacterium]|nr:amino acid adenylation domain-containing protein [Bacteroidales bacterium]